MPNAPTRTNGTPRGDAIRVVPMHLPPTVTKRAAGIQAPPAPRLTYRGGPLLGACEVYCLYWGSAWSKGTQKRLSAQLDAFFTYVLSSELIDQLAEYATPQFPIAHGRFVGSSVVSAPAPRASVGDSSVRRFLEEQIAAGGAVPPPGPDQLYFVYLPPGTAVVQGGARSCSAFCGYHDAIAGGASGEIFYAVMPYPGCAGCRGGLRVLDALTSTSSHELCESITDPIPGQGWYDDVHGEIGDICAWKTRRIGKYVVQLEWSNTAGKCI
jgi:hypothetical protein